MALMMWLSLPAPNVCQDQLAHLGVSIFRLGPCRQRREKTGLPPIRIRAKLMNSMMRKTCRNERGRAIKHATNESLQRSSSPTNLIKDGVLRLAALQFDKVMPPERVITLPLWSQIRAWSDGQMWRRAEGTSIRLATAVRLILP